jgi:hypothetical protein
MFHCYIKSVLECLKRHPEVAARDITVACFGGALQLHVPHCMALLGPNMRWEIWRADARFAPFKSTCSSFVQVLFMNLFKSTCSTHVNLKFVQIPFKKLN